jgi:group I intron endonuclease
MINIYCYENKLNGKVYIGQTAKSLLERYASGHGYKNCIHFERALKRDGFNNFDRWIFNIVSTQEEADQEEIFWIAEMRRLLGNDMVYNITNGGSLGSSRLGIKASEETKQKLSKAIKALNKKMSPENKAKLIAINTGRKMTDENRTKIMEGRKNMIFTDEIRHNMSMCQRGKIISEETREKISFALKGKIVSEDTKRKISKANKGKVSDKKGRSWKLIDGKRVWI